jgi:hypothetical protein
MIYYLYSIGKNIRALDLPSNYALMLMFDVGVFVIGVLVNLFPWKLI